MQINNNTKDLFLFIHYISLTSKHTWENTDDTDNYIPLIYK